MIRRFLRTQTFLKDFVKLPQNIQQKFDRQTRFLVAYGVRHPGLSAKKMRGEAAIWEARIDIHYRFTFQLQGQVIILRRIGTHEIYRKP